MGKWGTRGLEAIRSLIFRSLLLDEVCVQWRSLLSLGILRSSILLSLSLTVIKFLLSSLFSSDCPAIISNRQRRTYHEAPGSRTRIILFDFVPPGHWRSLHGYRSEFKRGPGRGMSLLRSMKFATEKLPFFSRFFKKRSTKRGAACCRQVFAPRGRELDHPQS